MNYKQDELTVQKGEIFNIKTEKKTITHASHIKDSKRALLATINIKNSDKTET